MVSEYMGSTAYAGHSYAFPYYFPPVPMAMAPVVVPPAPVEADGYYTVYVTPRKG